MLRRLVTPVLVTILLAAATVQPAFAENGNGNGNGNSGQNGNSDGAGNSDNAGSPSSDGDKGKSSAAPGRQDEDLALEALRAQDAVSLQEVLTSVRQSTSAKVIDAELVRLADMLVYVVKVLAPDGRVTLFYYDAGSGMELNLN